MKRNEKSKKDSTLAPDQVGITNATTTAENAEDLGGESNRAMTASNGEVASTEAKTTETTTTTAAKVPKEDKQLVYAELVLKPSDNNQPMPSKNSTEYAEIVYVQKPTPGAASTAPAAGAAVEKIDSKGKK